MVSIARTRRTRENSARFRTQTVELKDMLCNRTNGGLPVSPTSRT